MSREIFIELDERRRASLGRVGHPGHTRYLATTHDDGTITMRPVEVVPAVAGRRPATLAPPARPPRTDPDSVRANVRDLHRRLKEAIGAPHPTDSNPAERKDSA